MAIGQPSSHNVFLQIASEKTFMKKKIQSEVEVTLGYKLLTLLTLLTCTLHTVLIQWNICLHIFLYG